MSPVLGIRMKDNHSASKRSKGSVHALPDRWEVGSPKRGIQIPERFQLENAFSVSQPPDCRENFAKNDKAFPAYDDPKKISLTLIKLYFF